MSGYIGNIPVPQATQTRDVFTATSGQTSFATSGYTPNFLDVWLNGVKLVNVEDFTATNGSDVVLTTGATAGDTVEVLSYSTYEVNNQAFTGDFSVDGTTFKVDSTNNLVGIGTSSPANKLDVVGNITVGAAGAEGGQIDFRNPDGSTIGGIVDISSANVMRVFQGANNSLMQIGQLVGTGGTVAFYTAGSEKVRIDSLGNVGIGTSSPQTKVDITGSSTTEVSLRVGNAEPTEFSLGVLFSSGSAYNYIGIGAGETALYGRTGLVLAADNPGSGYKPIRFSTGGSERMRIDSSGRVGIGTSSPLDTLDVNGGIRARARAIFTGSQNVGTMLTATGGLGGAECISASASDAAFMTFHRPAAFASYFGIDTDNYFAVGGWSAGAGLAGFKCGALSKASGSFKIDHPLKPDTHHLVHSFVEGPQADNIYRGRVTLVDGSAVVNIDTVAGMTEGTFVALNRDIQCFTSNETGWCNVRGSVSGNILTIEAQDNACTDTISWLVIGERQDQHMYDTNWTDENGKVIVEPEKITALEAQP